MAAFRDATNWPEPTNWAGDVLAADGGSIRFAIISLSDGNESGTVDTLDFLAFLNARVAGEHDADFNGDAWSTRSTSSRS